MQHLATRRSTRKIVFVYFDLSKELDSDLCSIIGDPKLSKFFKFH